jgi:hypothetical protein
MASRAVRERLAQDIGLWLADGLVSKEAHDVLAERYGARAFGLANIIKSFGIAGGTLALFGLLGLVAAMARSKGVAALLLLAAGVCLTAFGIQLATNKVGRHALSSKVLLMLGVVMAAGGAGVGLDAAGVKGAQGVFCTGILVIFPMAFLAYRFKNTFLMVITLLLFFHWVGSWSSMVGRSTYEFDVQDPRLMTGAALAALIAGIYHERRLREQTGRFYLAYETFGLIYLNMSLLILTIGWHQTWSETRAWIVVWALAGILQIVAGARLHSQLLTGFGVTALAVNLYTRYFESYWSRMDAGLFFMLGGSALFLAGLLCEVLLRKQQKRPV